MEEEIKLEIIPENLFIKRIKWQKFLDEPMQTCCDNCNTIVTTTFYPYGYEKEENNIWSLGICPNCGEKLYIRD